MLTNISPNTFCTVPKGLTEYVGYVFKYERQLPKCTLQNGRERETEREGEHVRELCKPIPRFQPKKHWDICSGAA